MLGISLSTLTPPGPWQLSHSSTTAVISALAAGQRHKAVQISAAKKDIGKRRIFKPKAIGRT